jgi:hypothetical protein
MQYGQAFIAYYRMHGEVSSFLHDCMKMFPNLAPKYDAAIQEHQMQQAAFKEMLAERRKRLNKQRKYYGFELVDEDDPDYQLDMIALFGDGLTKEASHDNSTYQTPYQIPACSPAVDNEKKADPASDGGDSV